MRRWLPFTAFAVLLAFLFAGLWLDPREVPSPFIGKPAPAFSLPVLERPGQTFSPGHARGEPWLLNVWAPWCRTCRRGSCASRPSLISTRTGASRTAWRTWRSGRACHASTCAGCSGAVEKALSKLDGVSSAKVDLARSDPGAADVLLGWTLLGDPTTAVDR